MRNSGNLLFKAPPSGACLSLLLCCTEPKSLTTNGPTHRGHTCRSLDATFFPDALCMQLLLYTIMLTPVEGFPDRLVRHHIQPWSSLINPNLEGQKVCWDGHVRGNARLAFVNHFYSFRCTQLAKKFTKQYEIFR